MGSVLLFMVATSVLSSSVEDTVFVDLSGWVILAMENSPRVDLADADLMTSKASLLSSESFLWPTLTLRSTAGHDWGSVPDMTGGYTDTDNSNWSLSANVSQEILATGGSSWLRMHGSRRSYEAALYDREQVLRDLTLEIVEAYYGVIEAVDLLKSARRALARSGKQLSRISTLYDMGGATGLELVQARVQAGSDSLEVLRRFQAVSGAYSELYRAAGVTGSRYGVDTRAVLMPVSLETAMEFEADPYGNKSLAASEKRLEAARCFLDAAERSYLPSLNASGSWRWSNDEPDFRDFSDKDSWHVSLSLQWILFDGFNRESIIQSARASVLRREAARRQLLDSMESSLDTARQRLVASIKRWEQSRLVLEQAEERLRLSAMSYDLGGLSLLDLLDAQAAVASAEASVTSAKVACLVDEARLLVLAGQRPRLGE